MNQTKSKDKYDFQFLFNQLSDFATGFKIIQNQIVEHKGKQPLLVGILGNVNSGKSYILSQLTGYLFEQGINQTTEGFNIKSIEKDDKKSIIHYIDTAGYGESLKFYKKTQQNQNIQLQNQDELEMMRNDINKQKYQQLQEQILYEEILQGYIIERCHFVFVCLDVMNRENQKFINCIQNKLAERITSRKVKLIIIHNFMALSEKEMVEQKIKKDIINSFWVQQRYDELGGKLVTKFLDYTYSEYYPTIHVIMAMAKTEAGDYYNEGTINYVKKCIQENQENYEQYNIFDNLNEYLSKNIMKYLKLDNNDLNSKKMELVCEQKNNGIKKYYFKELREIYEKNQNLFQLNHVLFDYFERPLFNNPQCITPNYTIINSESGLCLIVDLPGISSQDWKNQISHSVSRKTINNQDMLYINIQANRNQQYYNNIIPNNYQIKNADIITEQYQIKYGIHYLTIPLTRDSDLYDPKSKTIDYISGQFILSYNKKKYLQEKLY